MKKKKKQPKKRIKKTKKGHIFKKFPERLYGQILDEYAGEIGVNVELLWKKTRNQDKFIREFARTYAHEVLHILIGAILEDLYFIGEEKTIRRMLKEKWSKKLHEYYKKHF